MTVLASTKNTYKRMSLARVGLFSADNLRCSCLFKPGEWVIHLTSGTGENIGYSVFRSSLFPEIAIE